MVVVPSRSARVIVAVPTRAAVPTWVVAVPVGSAAPITAVVPAIPVAVEVVVAQAAIPVGTPARVPPLARAPVVIRHGCGLCLSDRGTPAAQAEGSRTSENRCSYTRNSFHDAAVYPSKSKPKL